MADPGNGPHQSNRDRYDDELRALLEDAVSDVEPPPALHDIQIRTKVTPMSSKRPWIYAALGAVAATAATLVAVTVLADDDRQPVSGPAASDTPSLRTSTPPTDPTEPSADPTGAPATGTGQSRAVPVYYVGDTNTGPRLFREFHPGTGQGSEALLDALELAINGESHDPDYRSGWPGAGTSGGFSVAGAGGGNLPEGEPAISVALDAETDVSERPADMSADEAELALQQLVHTAQAVMQERLPVSFTAADGVPLSRLLGIDVAQGVQAADPMEVQGTVWVISPQDGDEVGSTFTVEGRGAFFEANVSWQLLRGSEPVAEGFATAEEGMTLSPYRFEVTDVEPGDYVLRVYDADMSGGEGNGEAEDTKRVIVSQ
jgi:hypothetical protein